MYMISMNNLFCLCTYYALAHIHTYGVYRNCIRIVIIILDFERNDNTSGFTILIIFSYSNIMQSTADCSRNPCQFIENECKSSPDCKL